MPIFIHSVEKVLHDSTRKEENSLRFCAVLWYNLPMNETIPTAAYLDLIQNGAQEKFERFRKTLIEGYKKFNLTSLTDEKEILYKHFLDSVAGERFFPQGASVCEVGSGAGFPSIPLKLIRDDLRFALIESTGKKCEFLRAAVQTLGLSDMEVFNLRAEEAGKMEKFREKFDVCCARAVARLNTLAEYCLPLVKKGGRFIAYKGNADEEIEEAEKAISLLGGRTEKIVKFSLPENAGLRTLVIVKKIGQTPEKYPRGRGKERSAPIRG